MSRIKYDRFIGHGNFMIDGRKKAWRIKCSRCEQTKIINAHGKRSSLPPELVIRKLSSTGWYIGNKDSEDLCPNCQRKPAKPQSNIEFAKKALTGLVAPLVGNNGQRFPFTELLSIVKTLEPDQAKELIKVLRERLPEKAPPKTRPPKPLPPTDDTDYEQWLNEQK